MIGKKCRIASSRFRVSVAAALFAMSAALLVSSVRAGDDAERKKHEDEIISKILQDWKARSRSVDTLILEANGTELHPKGLYNNDPSLPQGFKGTFPKEDYAGLAKEVFVIDYRQGLLRNETLLPLPNLSVNPPVMDQSDTVFVYDGKKVALWVRGLDPKNPSGHVNWYRPTGVGSRMWFNIRYDPIAWGFGNVAPEGIGRNKIERLRPSLKKSDLTYVGVAECRGRRVHRVRVGIRPTGYTELWVDVERDSIIVRADWYSLRGRKQHRFKFELYYRQADDRWLLKEWSIWVKDGPTTRLTVTRLEINKPMDEFEFSIPMLPGMTISDERGPKAKRYRVDKNGQLIPLVDAKNTDRT